MLALLEAFDNEATGEAVEAALARRGGGGDRARRRRTTAALVANALAALPGDAATPLRVLTLGSTGAMGGGQFGTAVSAILTAHHAERREVHALVAEGRPGLEGARVATWELAQAAVPHALVTDAAAAGCIAAGEVDAVLVDRGAVCANGDVVGGPRARTRWRSPPHAAGIPFLVLCATTAVDLATRTRRPPRSRTAGRAPS